jgi:hypothetical protein
MRKYIDKSSLSYLQPINNPFMVELVDTHVLETCAERCESSILSKGTKIV